MTINEEEAKKTIESISSNIPGAVVESDYYIEDNKLVITKGQEGLQIDTDKLIEIDSANSTLIKDGKIKIEDMQSLYESVGTTCE